MVNERSREHFDGKAFLASRRKPYKSRASFLLVETAWRTWWERPAMGSHSPAGNGSVRTGGVAPDPRVGP